MHHEPLLRSIAKRVLGPDIATKVWSRIEIIGDIAIIRKPFDLDIDVLKPLAEELLRELKYVKSVWLAITPVHGIERVRRYIHLAGEHRSETIYREHGCSFRLDITKVYISPVLSYDHIRTAKLIKRDEIVLNMFAGVGGYSIVISRHATPKYVLSIDINPYAIRYLRENIELNHVDNINEVILGDALKVVEGFRKEFDRVLLPLPELVYNALPKAFNVVKPSGWLHPHLFVNANKKKEAFAKAKEIVERIAIESRVRIDVVGGHVIRSVGPRRYHVVLDTRLLS